MAEIIIAATGAAAFSAVKAALDDAPEFKKRLTAKLQSLLPNATPLAHDVLRKQLGGMALSLDADKRSLDGSRRGLTDADIAAVARALQATPAGTILKLNLSHTPLSEPSARALAQAHLSLSRLSALRLRGCALGDVGAVFICRALHHPEASSSSRLSELALASNHLTPSAAPEIAEALRELPALHSLDLSYNALGGAGCALLGEALSERRVLRALSLASCNLDDAAIVAVCATLREVPLGEIDLDGNAAGDAAVGALLGLATRGTPLITLRLSANAIGVVGAAALAAHLASRPGGPLRSLALSNNPLTPDGCEALRAALRSNHAISELSLTGAGAPPEALLEISEAVARNRASHRQVSRTQTKSMLRAASAQIAARMEGDIAAALGGASAAAAGGEAGGTSDSTPPGYVPYSPPPSVMAPSSDMPMAASATLPAVPTTPPDAPYAVADWRGHPGAGAPLSARAFDTPAAYASAHGMRMHGGHFSPSFAPTGDLSAGVVRQRRELHILPSARIVLLDGAGLRDEHADELSDYLRDNSHTELLHLASNELTDSGVGAIAASLFSCGVRRLSLASNHLQDGGALALAQALCDGFAPEQLDLSDNMLTEDGAAMLVETAVRSAPSLRWLDLRLNPLISDEGRALCAQASVGASFDLKL